MVNRQYFMPIFFRRHSWIAEQYGKVFIKLHIGGKADSWMTTFLQFARHRQAERRGLYQCKNRLNL